MSSASRPILESWDISSRSFRISWMNNWRSEMVGIKGNKKLLVQFNILCMIYRWWNRGVSWGSNKLQINSVQTSDPNLNPNSVKLEFELGSSWGSSWRSSWRSLKHPNDSKIPNLFQMIKFLNWIGCHSNMYNSKFLSFGRSLESQNHSQMLLFSFFWFNY